MRVSFSSRGYHWDGEMYFILYDSRGFGRKLPLYGDWALCWDLGLTIRGFRKELVVRACCFCFPTSCNI